MLRPAIRGNGKPLLWAFPTPHICWLLDRLGICLSQLVVANHEDCHFMFQSWSGDAKGRRDHSDHLSPPDCWTWNGVKYFEHLVQSRHLFGVWS